MIQSIWVNMVPVLDIIKDNMKCTMLKFQYNNQKMEIRELYIFGFKISQQKVDLILWEILGVVT